MDKIRVGIVGAGYIGGVHAGLLARDERVVLTAVHDVVEGRARRLAAPAGARVAASAEELIDEVDAVYVTTPNTLHTELAVAAAQAGKHVFCEKPMATNLRDARRVLELNHPDHAYLSGDWPEKRSLLKKMWPFDDEGEQDS